METVTLRPWSTDDVDLLHAANTAAMTAHLNGPESDREIDDRNARYLRLNESGHARMHVVEDAGDHVGSIGCWHVDWNGAEAWETGWFVLSHAQGRGIASLALGVLVQGLRADPAGRRWLVAFPAVGNGPSNGVCRSHGFELVGRQTETFRGRSLEINEWVLDLGSS